MGEPIENEYFNWLCAMVLPRDTHNYVDLASILYRTEFVWVVPRDRHRAEDGIELRSKFLERMRDVYDDHWMTLPCSVLELLVAFADRASFQTDQPIQDWFLQFLVNLRLDGYRQVSPSDEPVIDDILQTFMWRTYEPEGDGGLFPMRNPRRDQRKVEIWYQFCEYLEDQGLL